MTDRGGRRTAPSDRRAGRWSPGRSRRRHAAADLRADHRRPDIGARDARPLRTELPLPPAHFHPTQTERFLVLEGQLLFIVDGSEHRLGPGGVLEIPPGRVHQARNERDEPALAVWQTRPALRTAEFHEAIARARAGGDIGELIGVVSEYADVFVLAEQPVA